MTYPPTYISDNHRDALLHTEGDADDDIYDSDPAFISHPALDRSSEQRPSSTMGGCMSTSDRAGRQRSDEIDKMIEEDSKRFKKECKILLLGSGESGKSTIVKQMKIIHQNGFTKDELESYRPIIYKNVLDSAQAIVLAMRKIGVEPERYSNRVSVPPRPIRSPGSLKPHHRP